MYAHTHTHTLNLIHLTPVQKGKLYCDSNTRCSFSVDVNAPLSYLHLCVNPLAPPFSGLNFFQMFWTNANLIQRKGKVVSAKWFTMNWCIKVIFSLDSSDLVKCSSFSSVMPFLCQSSAIVKNFPSCLLCSKSLRAMYCQSPYSCMSLHAVCISCCLKCRISTKMFVFVQEQEVL